MNPLGNETDAIIETQLNNCLSEIEKELKAEAIAYVGAIRYGAEEVIRDSIEELPKKLKHVLMILETEGGYIEVAKRIADILRKHYATVSFLIPNSAMSAGTVLVMSGDNIYMDYFSILGPIDPQVRSPGDDVLIPALGYLEKYKQLVEKSETKKGLSRAELAYFIKNFNPAELYAYEQAKSLSNKLLKEWLVKFKFKNWKKTATRKKIVTGKMKIKRASEIANKLNNTNYWHSHAHGISMEVARTYLNLKIEDFGEKQKLNNAVRKYYKILMDFMKKYSLLSVVHTQKRFTPLVRRSA